MSDKPTITSAHGKSEIRHREKDVAHYEGHHGSHDGKKYHIGSLTHHGDHAASKKTEHHNHAHDFDTKLAEGIHHAEQIVHRYVKHFHLTQAQFDALVSYVYSVGEQVARSALQAADQGDLEGTGKHIEQCVMIHHHSVEKPLHTHAPIKSRFLEKRRHEEAKPFYHSSAEEHSHAKRWGHGHEKKSEQKSGHHSGHVFATKPEHPFGHHSDHSEGNKANHKNTKSSNNHGWDSFKVFSSKK